MVGLAYVCVCVCGGTGELMGKLKTGVRGSWSNNSKSGLSYQLSDRQTGCALLPAESHEGKSNSVCVCQCVGVNACECSGLHLWVSQPIIPQRQSQRVVTESEGQSEGFCTNTLFLQPPPFEKNTLLKSLKEKQSSNPHTERCCLLCESFQPKQGCLCLWRVNRRGCVPGPAAQACELFLGPGSTTCTLSPSLLFLLLLLYTLFASIVRQIVRRGRAGAIRHAKPICSPCAPSRHMWHDQG